MQSRSVRRPGYSNLVGALNPKVTVSTEAPYAPAVNNIWINSTTNSINYWNGSEWINSTGEGVYTKTDSTAIQTSEQGTILCSKTSSMTITLPTAVGNIRLHYHLSNINTGTVTITPYGSETIQGDSSFDLYQDESLNIVSDGYNWYVN